MAVRRMTEKFDEHHPVLLNETLSALLSSTTGIYVDATFGRGNHTRAILEHLDQEAQLIAFDKDPEAISYGKQHFFQEQRLTLLHSSFAKMQTALSELKLMGKVQGILFDLGVSSPQLNNPNRGFSFMREGPLDMRMDISQGMSAAEWLEHVDEKTLAEVLWEYGEERYARRLARAIVAARLVTPITTTKQLAQIVVATLPRVKFHEKHPATRCFQAIRIAINQELSDLSLGLEQALDALKIGGRLAVISFHSLEDRIVKQFARKYEKGEALPRYLPIKENFFTPRLAVLTKPIKPSETEINLNPRARSAILRVMEKLS